jgi:ATP-dependent helicase/nuclease subunit B
MAIKRHFLGWDEPVVRKVLDYLIPQPSGSPIDLRTTLVLVPTQQAGRRLRQAMALREAEHGIHHGSLLPKLPIDLVREPSSGPQPASAMECGALWARLLLDMNHAAFPALFPASSASAGFAWALSTGKLIQSVRHELAAAGLTISAVAAGFIDRLQEPDRWIELARLERTYLDLVRVAGRVDPSASRVEQSLQPRVMEGTRRIVLACAPDPDLVALAALERLAEDMPVDVLIHAPEALADSFDLWGRAIPARWGGAPFDMPDAAQSIRLAGTPSEQSRLAVSILAGETRGPLDMGIGVPDDDIIPFLAAEMRAVGLSSYDPEGKPVALHPLCTLVEHYRGLLDDGSYASVAALLRQPDILDYLRHALGLQPHVVLRELDEFQNLHLPPHIHAMRGCLADNRKFGTLATALERLTADAPDSQAEPSAALRDFLRTVFTHRQLAPNEQADAEFAAVAQQVADALSHIEEGCIPSLHLAPSDVRSLVVDHLRSLKYDAARQGTAVDLEGWLELHWNDAPLLVVTGMNEGKVPESLAADPFLPNSLRRTLGLRSDEDRYARDLYLMRAMVESRRSGGRACFICGKTGASGDPLKPSRLLFACRNDDLPARARTLFGTPESVSANHPATTSFLLRPSPPADLPPARHDVEAIAVTAFRDYLACPFRFYLKRILRMKAIDDLKTEMDAADFGALIHDVVHRMGQNESLRTCDDARELTRFLHAEAEGWMTRRFGTPLPLNLQMQLDAALQRLAAVARTQAVDAADGWEIVLVEHPIEQTIEGLRVFGRIDRLDRHRGTGQVRVLDYKTSDSALTPEKEHLRNPSDDMPDYARAIVDGSARRWLDLQLPLYVFMLAAQDATWSGAVPGYFNIPGAADSTRIVLWTTFNGDIADSAADCAREVARAIRARRFWPPARRVTYDDFQTIFRTDAASCVDIDSFSTYLEARA